MVQKLNSSKSSKNGSEKNGTVPAPDSQFAEIDRVFELQKNNRWNIANTDARTRIEKLNRLKDAIQARSHHLKDAMYKDFKKSPYEVEITEIYPVISEINDAIHNLRKWMEPVPVPSPMTMFGSSSRLVYEPKGLCLIIGPWNYPFHLIMAPLAAAIAAGNCVIIRPSSNTRHTSEFTESLLKSIYSEDEICVFNGTTDMANHLLTKRFDHIFFTGSPSVGTHIMEAAAKNLASVTLELGGKSPVIIDETASLDYASSHVVWGKVLNGGQTCVGVDYVLVHESREKEFLEKAKEKLKKFYGPNTEEWSTNPDFCRIINDKSFQRLKYLIDETVKAGASVEMGGILDAAQKYISPTILSKVPLSSAIMQEEIFGPIMPVITYRNLDEAIRIIQSKDKPLALYMFSESDSNIHKVLKDTSSGGAVINGVIVHLANANLPFGGVNHSGLGSYHGYFGFKTFSHERAVLRVNKLNILDKVFPPYGDFTTQLVNLMIKFF